MITIEQFKAGLFIFIVTKNYASVYNLADFIPYCKTNFYQEKKKTIFNGIFRQFYIKN